MTQSASDPFERLHPNLARIARRHDQIIRDFGAGKIDSRQATELISKLEARDDQGVKWRISPRDGLWYRQTVDGRMVRDNPPTSGVPTASPENYSPFAVSDDQNFIIRPSDELLPVTHPERDTRPPSSPSNQSSPLVSALVAIAVAALVLFIVIQALT